MLVENCSYTFNVRLDFVKQLPYRLGAFMAQVKMGMSMPTIVNGGAGYSRLLAAHVAKVLGHNRVILA